MKHCQSSRKCTLDEYERIVSEKWNYLSLLQRTASIGQSVFDQSRDIVRDRPCRLNFCNKVTHTLRCSQKHNADIIDSDLSNL